MDTPPPPRKIAMEPERALEGDSTKALSMLGGAVVVLQVCAALSRVVCNVADIHASRQSFNYIEARRITLRGTMQ